MRKLLNTLYITDETAYLTLDGENIVCKLENAEKFRLPFSNVEEIFCFSYLGCSPALLGKCAEEGVAVSFISPQGKFLARVQGCSRGNVYLRREQILTFDNSPPLLYQNTVATKLRNTKFLIKRSKKDYPELDEKNELTNCIEQLERGIESVYATEDKDVILGIEGNCAKAYFYIFDKLIIKQKEDFHLSGRTKRPPTDKVNAILSFLYTIATYSCASALESVGLDSYVGFYHELRPGRVSLACDMVEEIRCIIERLVLTMINLKILSADDFETQVSGAVFLNKEGKRKVLTQWQEKKRSVIVHPYLNEKIPFGLLPYAQSSLLAKYIRKEIEEYPCYLVK